VFRVVSVVRGLDFMESDSNTQELTTNHTNHTKHHEKENVHAKTQS
jgi:hypothetical protein